MQTNKGREDPFWNTNRTLHETERRELFGGKARLSDSEATRRVLQAK